MPISHEPVPAGAHKIAGLMTSGAVGLMDGLPAIMHVYNEQNGPCAAFMMGVARALPCPDVTCRDLHEVETEEVIVAGYEGLAALAGQILAFLDQLPPLQGEHAFGTLASTREQTSAHFRATAT